MGLFSRTIPFSNKIIRIIKYLKNYDALNIRKLVKFKN